MAVNAFQERTAEKLRLLFEMKGGAASFEVAGDALKASFADYEFWIYPDGAGASGNGIDRRFEIYDYDSLRALQGAYVDFVRQLVAKPHWDK